MRRTLQLCTLTILFLAGALLWSPSHAQDTISIAEARNQGVGASVTVEGTVTRAFGDFVRLQDESGPTGASAIVIRQTGGAFFDDVQDGTIAPGTQLRTSGTISVFYGLLQINDGDLDSYSVEGQGSPPSPQSVSIGDLMSNGENYESELIRLDEISFVSASGTFDNRTTYSVQSSTGETIDFRVQTSSETALTGEPIPSGAFSFEGVVGQFNNQRDSSIPNEGYQLIPVRPSDLQESSSFSFGQLFSNVQEGDGTVSVEVRAFNLQADDNISVTARVGEASTATNGTDVTGFTSPQTLTFSGSNPAPQMLSFDVVADSETEGIERLEVTLESADGAIASPSQFTLWIRDDATAQGTIASGVAGDDLISRLQATFGDPPTLGYDIARDSMYATIYNENGEVEGIYTGFRVPVDPDGGDASEQAGDGGINTEHLWPRSKGSEEEPALSNMHILAPARGAVNSGRSNYAYGEIPDADTDSWYFEDQTRSAPPASNLALWSELDDSPSNRDDRRFEPRHSVKGDVARAAFYFVTIYPNRANLQFYEAQKETLFDWHQQDPVDAVEMRRNILQASYQGNKLNPFIVDPALIDRAYFSGGGSPGGDVLAISEARTQGGGTVTVEGVVTRVGPEGAYIQDDTAGLYIFQEDGAFNSDLGGSIRSGTRLQVTGSLEFYNGLLELTDVPDDRYQMLSQDNALPEAPTLTLSEIAANGEDYEAELVRVESFTIDDKGNETFRAGGSQGNYPIGDGTGELTLRIPGGSELESESIPERATFEGVLGQFNGAGFDADEPDNGYQLTAFEVNDLSAQTSVPDMVSYDIELPFPGAEDPQDYRLVALPGAIDAPLANTLSGSAGMAWQAYWDTGAESDYLVRFDGSETFDFQPGNGFWLVSQDAWAAAGEVETVSLDGTGRASVDLHAGWNIVSNPLDVDVAWDAVTAASGGGLQPLWEFGGSFRQTASFASAKDGAAFYFLNSGGLDALQIPYPGLSTAPGAKGAPQPPTTMALAARFSEDVTATVHVGFAPDAAPGLDAYDWVAPTTHFNPERLLLPCTACASERQGHLARDVRPAPSEGHAFDLTLSGKRNRTVTLAATDARRFAPREVVLLNPASGRTYDLQRDSTVTLALRGETMSLRLLIGTASFVRQEQTAASPERTTLLPPYPNPFRNQTTVEYTLPEPRDVRVAVYDALGRRVRVLVEQQQAPGRYNITWDGTDATNRPAASGLYLVRLEAGPVRQTRKVVLVR